MAFHSYVSFKGSRQGVFKGETTNPSRKDKWSDVVSFRLGVESPVDQSSGQVSGKRQHNPFHVTKETGNATPVLFEPTNSPILGLTNPVFPTVNPGGQQSGNRKNGPITITKEVGTATPQLLQACLGNETLSEVIIEVTGPNVSGIERIWRRLTLTDVVIVNVRHRVGEETPARRVVSDFVLMCGGVRDEALSGA